MTPDDRVRWCVHCGQRRPLEELIAFWPAGQIRDEVPTTFVCRPTLNEAGRYGQPCFRVAVGPRQVHAIGTAA